MPVSITPKAQFIIFKTFSFLGQGLDRDNEMQSKITLGNNSWLTVFSIPICQWEARKDQIHFGTMVSAF
jgi:hypothetical protein